jgi:hypothetical protein
MARRRRLDQEPADRLGDDRKGRHQRQDHRRRGGAKVFRAITANQFYVFSHESPKALGNITHRMQNIVAMENPADPFLETPEIGARLRQQLRGR